MATWGDIGLDAFKLVAEVAAGALQVNGARELNYFEVAASTERYNFFRELNSDTNTSGYLTRLSSELFEKYDEMAGQIGDPFAKQQAQNFLTKKKEEDRQAALNLSDRNSRVFGAQELITSLDILIARGIGAEENLIPTDTDPGYLRNRINEMTILIGDAYASGIIDADRASELSREYRQKWLFGQSRDMAFEALNTLIGENVPVGEALTAIEKALRTEGEVEDFGLEVESDKATMRLALLAQAYAGIDLTPDDEEMLVGQLRREATYLADRQVAIETEKIEINDIEVSTLWAQGREGRNKLMADNYALLYESFPNTPEGRKEIGKWIRSLGEWDLQLTEKTQQEEQKRTYDIEIQGIVEDRNETAIPDLISKIQQDTLILDAERDQMVNFLNTMEREIKAEKEAPEEDDTSAIDWELLKAAYDEEIVDIRYEITKKDTGTGQKIRDLIERIQRDPDFKIHEQDRNERIDDLFALFDEWNETPPEESASVARSKAETRISLMLSNKRYSKANIRDAILEEETSGNLPADDANTWRKRLDEREVVYLGDYHAKEAFAGIDRFFDSALRDPDNDEEMRASLLQDQITVLDAVYTLLDSPTYREETDPSKQKEMLDDIINDVMAPATQRSLIQKLGAAVGLVGPPSKYEEFKYTTSESYRDSLFKEIRTEWFTQFQEDYPTAWLTDEIHRGNFDSRYRKVDDEWTIEIRHRSSGLMLTQRKGRWYVMFPGDSDYTRVGTRERKRLEAYRG